MKRKGQKLVIGAKTGNRKGRKQKLGVKNRTIIVSKTIHRIIMSQKNGKCQESHIKYWKIPGRNFWGAFKTTQGSKDWYCCSEKVPTHKKYCWWILMPATVSLSPWKKPPTFYPLPFPHPPPPLHPSSCNLDRQVNDIFNTYCRFTFYLKNYLYMYIKGFLLE